MINRKKQKGISLPINLIIVIVIAVFVLVYLSTFFLGLTGSQMSRAQAEEIYNIGCHQSCGATVDSYLEGYNIAYATDERYNQFRDACITLGYIQQTSNEPQELARGVLTCLQTCGNCYLEQGDAEQHMDATANIANSGLNP